MFVFLGKKIIVFLGVKGNNFILNGKYVDFNVEGIYGKFMILVFGEGVIYDCLYERFMEYKRVCSLFLLFL